MGQRVYISIHEVFADLDGDIMRQAELFEISIHEVFADLDAIIISRLRLGHNFNPRGLRRPRRCSLRIPWTALYFNPRGLRRPRQFFYR